LTDRSRTSEAHASCACACAECVRAVLPVCVLP
jgi:hypothetical protein